MTRTTVVLDDVLFKQVKDMAFKERKPFKQTMMTLLRAGLRNRHKEKQQAAAFRLRTFNSEGSTVPIHDREALFDKMDEAE